jgi:predicted Zn-dependent protease
MVEAIPTWNGGEESVELYEAYNFTEFSRDAIVAEIDGKMREVRDRLAAIKPTEKLSCPVVLCAPEVATLAEELAYELNYSKIYNHSNAFSVGDEIQKAPKGDKLTVTMKGKMKGSVSSASFDGDGATLVDTKVIEDGRAVGSFGTVRYASYLGKEATGDLRCVFAECGSVSDEALKSAPYFKCVSMSGLQLDIYSDYIGGEVRLAYYFDGEKEIPVTGISISGKLSEALSGMRLSSEETVYEGYKGPKYAIFDSIEIV